MSNRIIKDFKGWSLIHENKDDPNETNPYRPETQEYLDWEQNHKQYNPAEQDLINKYNASVASQPAQTQATQTPVAAAGTAGTAGTSAVTKAVTSVPAAPIVPTPDLIKASPTALTRNDWAAIQTKLNALELAAANTAAVNSLKPPADAAATLPYANIGPNMIKENKVRSMTRLYEEQLVPDGVAGPKTLLAIDTFVSNYNLNPANTTKLPADPLTDKATATTINPLVLAAIAAAAAPATSTPDTTAAPTGPAAIKGSVFGTSANITEADFTPQITKNAPGYESEPTKLLLATAKQFKAATAGPGTNEANMIASIKACKSASDFYKLNAVIKNAMSGDIAYIINDELEDDNLADVQTIKNALGLIGVTAAFLEEDKKNLAAQVIGKQFKEKSFTITIPKGSDPATVFPPPVYAVAVKQTLSSTGSGDILYY